MASKLKLSDKAAKAKHERDVKIATGKRRTKMKAESQAKRRELEKKGVDLKGKDIHHSSNGKLAVTSVNSNRSGTKSRPMGKPSNTTKNNKISKTGNFKGAYGGRINNTKNK